MTDSLVRLDSEPLAATLDLGLPRCERATGFVSPPAPSTRHRDAAAQHELRARTAALVGVDLPDVAPALTTGQARYLGWRRHAKRAFDLAAAVVGLLALLPVLAVLAAAVMITSPGTPLFGQQRIGRDGRVFRCWKLRSMYLDAEERLRRDDVLYRRYLENDFKLDEEDDPRITRLGRMLRKTSLDELPQLWNVVRGDMSLVGPRPIVTGELRMYGEWRYAYLRTVPGLTGVWQCSGRNDIRYPERAQLDAEYLDGWSFWRDVAIVLRTVPAVLRSKGVA